MTTVRKELIELPFEEFKAYILRYSHITESPEKLYADNGGELPKKGKGKKEGEE